MTATSLSTRTKEPVIFDGAPIEIDYSCHDGRLEPAMGVHSYQVVRANRTDPQDRNHRCCTYNHQPMLAYWHGKFYLQYLAAHHNEHSASTETFLTVSENGIDWDRPQVIFPAIEYATYHSTIAHQRMGFYVAPNGRLLTLSFYGLPQDSQMKNLPQRLFRMPNTGHGIGRAVREIYEDGSLGPIHFFRYMPKSGYTEETASKWYPHYSKSSDPGFVEACDALYADKLVCQQMWEEDRNNDDGFFGIHWEDNEYASGKALSYWTNPDGSVTGFWKGATAAVTTDHGKTWSEIAECATIHKNTSKYWGQKTPDGRYAFVYTPMKTKLRHPLVVLTGEDGQHFDDMLVVNPEMPLVRFAGTHKDLGQNYVRGIVEGNGTPPGPCFWVAYSMNKEDIWVSRIPVPVTGVANEPVDDDFTSSDAAETLNRWNLYSGKWAHIRLAEVGGERFLHIEDCDPYDYAKAFRLFPESAKLNLNFNLQFEEETEGVFEVEVQGRGNHRPVRIIFDRADSSVRIAQKDGSSKAAGTFAFGQWHEVELHIDTSAGAYDLLIDGQEISMQTPFAEPADSLKRLEFRTGPYRMEDERIYKVEPEQCFDDREGADTPDPVAACRIGYVRTAGHQPPS